MFRYIIAPTKSGVAGTNIRCPGFLNKTETGEGQEPRAYSRVTKFVHDDRNSVSVVLSEDASDRNVNMICAEGLPLRSDALQKRGLPCAEESGYDGKGHLVVGRCCFIASDANNIPLKFRLNQEAVREIRFTKRCAENDVAGWVGLTGRLRRHSFCVRSRSVDDGDRLSRLDYKVRLRSDADARARGLWEHGIQSRFESRKRPWTLPPSRRVFRFALQPYNIPYPTKTPSCPYPTLKNSVS